MIRGVTAANFFGYEEAGLFILEVHAVDSGYNILRDILSAKTPAPG